MRHKSMLATFLVSFRVLCGESSSQLEAEQIGRHNPTSSDERGREFSADPDALDDAIETPRSNLARLDAFGKLCLVVGAIVA